MIMLRRFAFRPDATEILVSIASAVAVAGGTLFLLLFALLASGRLTGAPGLTLPAGGGVWVLAAGGTVFVLALAALWWHSKHTAPAAPLVLRAAYSVGLALVGGWWVAALGFGVLFWLAA